MFVMQPARLLIALIFIATFGEEAMGQSLLGRWRSAETSTSGLGSMMIFRPDGVVDFSAGAVVEMTYRLEGGEIVFPAGTVKGPEQRQKLQFTGPDKVRIAEADFQRQGPVSDSKQPLLGEWVGKSVRNGMQIESHFFFYREGKCLLLLPFKFSGGRYVVRGATLRLELPNMPVLEGQFQVDGDVLTAPGEHGGVNRLKRY